MAFDTLNDIDFVFQIIVYTSLELYIWTHLKKSIWYGLELLRFDSQSLKFTKIHRTPILSLGRDDKYPVFGRSVIKHFRKRIIFKLRVHNFNFELLVFWTFW